MNAIKYLVDANYGIGIVQNIGEKKTTVFFPKIRSTKNYITKNIEANIIDESAELIELLNRQHKTEIGFLNPGASHRIWRSDGYFRTAQCYMCKTTLDSDTHYACGDCGWLVCPKDGACGCRYSGP